MKWKMIALIILGMLIASITIMTLHRYSIYSGDVYLFVALSFYPLALVYGRGVMVDIFHSIYLGVHRPIKRNTAMAKCINLLAACFAFIFASWIHGTYHAYKKYQISERFSIK